MPKAWTDKDDRQYQHIREQQLERGKSKDEAEEIAARTVNKQRRVESRTTNVRTQGTGNPNTPLDQRSRDELYNRAKELHIEGRSRMNKEQLVREIKRREGSR